jgi:hypothetical protein
MESPVHVVRRIVVLAVLATLLACSSRDPVQKLLGDIKDALEDQDAKAIGALLTDDFVGADGSDKAAVVSTLQRYLGAYRSLDVEISKVETNQRSDSARVTFRAKASGAPRNLGGLGDMLPRSISYDFDLTLRNESGTWRISQASWNESGGAAGAATPPSE